MKKYKNPIPDGGAPLHNNRLLTELNEELWAAIEGVLKGISSACIVSGCTVTNPSNFVIASGVVYINGLFLRFAGASVASLPQYIYAGPIADVNKTFADGASKALLTTQEALITAVDPGGNRIAVNNLLPTTLRDLIHLKSDVIDNFTSVIVNQALSANAGKSLNDRLATEEANRIAADALKVSKAGDSMSGALTSTNTGEFQGGVRTSNAGPFLKTKIVELGAWNMDTLGDLSPAHGLSSHMKIRSIEVMIQNDGGTIIYSFFHRGSAAPEGYVGNISTATIPLFRTLGGFFDNAAFSGGGNRGWLYIVFDDA